MGNVKLTCGPGLTRQSCKDECDINKIMHRYQKTGRLPELIKENPVYGDFSTAGDYQQSLETIKRAEEQFNALPSTIRSKFNNNPAEFLSFCENKNNTPELIKMGLAIDKTPKTPKTQTQPNTNKEESQEKKENK